jgi:hypothetical protein
VAAETVGPAEADAFEMGEVASSVAGASEWSSVTASFEGDRRTSILVCFPVRNSSSSSESNIGSFMGAGNSKARDLGVLIASVFSDLAGAVAARSSTFGCVLVLLGRVLGSGVAVRACGRL